MGIVKENLNSSNNLREFIEEKISILEELIEREKNDPDPGFRWFAGLKRDTLVDLLKEFDKK